MKGWKMWASAAMVVVLGTVQALESTGTIPHGMGNVASSVLGALAGALGIVGVGHKIEKLGK